MAKNNATYKKHGLSRTPEWMTWNYIRQRCLNPSNKDYAKYGGRGIKLCAAWNDFATFYADMGVKPGKQYTIDRIDPKGDYEPSNCRWATVAQQNMNRRKMVADRNYKGILWHKGRWASVVTKDRKQFWVAYSDDPAHAAYIRDQIALQLHGEFANLNFELA